MFDKILKILLKIWKIIYKIKTNYLYYFLKEYFIGDFF